MRTDAELGDGGRTSSLAYVAHVGEIDMHGVGVPLEMRTG